MQCEMTMDEQMERLDEVAEAYNNLPDDATNMDILEMIAGVTGETVTEVHERFLDSKEGKI